MHPLFSDPFSAGSAWMALSNRGEVGLSCSWRLKIDTSSDAKRGIVLHHVQVKCSHVLD